MRWKDKVKGLALLILLVSVLSFIAAFMQTSALRQNDKAARKDRFSVYVSKERYSFYSSSAVLAKKRNPTAKYRDLLLERLQEAEPATAKLAGGFYDDFRSADQVAAYLERLARRFPSMAKFGSIGKTFEKRDILAVRVSSSTGGNNKPNLVFIGTEHGREWIVPMVLVYVCERALQNTTKWMRIREMANLWFIPVLNPDGLAFTHSSDSGRFWRKNRQVLEDGIGIDLNRNWGSRGFTWGHSQGLASSEVYQGETPFQALETAALNNWIMSHKLDARVKRAKAKGIQLNSLVQGFIAFHCCIGGVLQPRNYCSIPSDVELLHELLGKAMVKDLNKGNGSYSFKRRRKTMEISSSGVSVDWAYYDARIPYPFLIETSPMKASLKDLERRREEEQGTFRSIQEERKQKIQEKMELNSPRDIVPTGEDVARAISTFAEILVGLKLCQKEADAPALRMSFPRWGFTKGVPTPYQCKQDGKPDLTTLDPCQRSQLKPWMARNCKKHRSKKRHS